MVIIKKFIVIYYATYEKKAIMLFQEIYTLKENIAWNSLTQSSKWKKKV